MHGGCGICGSENCVSGGPPVYTIWTSISISMKNPKRDPHLSFSVHAGLSYFVIQHHNCAPWWMLQFLIKRLFFNNIHDSSPCPIVQQPATVCAQSRNKDPAAERGHIAHCEFWRDLNLPSSQGNAVFYFDPCMLVGKTVCQGICKTHYGNQFFSH